MSTGVKDTITQYWIEELLARYRKSKEEGLPPPEIQTKLKNWAKENKSRIYNEHLTTRGMTARVRKYVRRVHPVFRV